MRKAIVRAIKGWKSVGEYIHHGCYVSDMIDIATRVFGLGTIDAESDLVSARRFGKFPRLNKHHLTRKKRQAMRLCGVQPQAAFN